MKKIQQEDQDKINKLISLCIKLQNLGYGDVFFSLSPHCELVWVRGYKEGFETNKPPEFSMDGYYGKSGLLLKTESVDLIIQFLDSKVEALSF